MTSKLNLIFASFVLALVLQAEVKADFSQLGNFAVEVIEFRDLWDHSREGNSEKKRFRIFRRRQNETQSTKGRNIPVKLHLPLSSSPLPYPVVLISHGAGGSWDTHYAQAYHLASHGYAALCLEHVGSNTERLKSGLRVLKNLKDMIHDSEEVLGRPRDLSFILDQIEEWNRHHPKLKGRFDLNRVGVMGHSFGAFTVMAVSGMKPALDWIEPKVGLGKGLGPDFFEKRLKCGIALSPQAPGEPFFLKDSYSTLRIPLMGISGTNDKQQNGNPPMARYESFKLWPEMSGKNLFVWLENASHLDFTDSKGGEEHGRDSSNRADVQTLVRAATVLFFKSCLNQDVSFEKLLTTDGLKPYLRGKISSAEVRSK